MNPTTRLRLLAGVVGPALSVVVGLVWLGATALARWRGSRSGEVGG